MRATADPARDLRAGESGIAVIGLGTTARIARAVSGSPADLVVKAADTSADLRVLQTGWGVLESAIVDDRGRLLFTSQTRKAVLRMDAPDADPTTVATGIESPGGLALAGDGRIIVGFGDSPLGGLIGNVAPRAGLLLVDPDTGALEPWVTGLGMANGVARAPDGTVFASNDLGTHIDRVTPAGAVQRRWAKVPSANGLALSPDGDHLYAAQTFVRAAIKRVEIANPDHVVTYARPALPAAFVCLDGLAIDDAGVLYAAANAAGQIWRIAADGSIRAIARGLSFPSAVALGRGATGFRAGNLYVVTFAGDVIELAGD